MELEKDKRHLVIAPTFAVYSEWLGRTSAFQKPVLVLEEYQLRGADASSIVFHLLDGYAKNKAFAGITFRDLVSRGAKVRINPEGAEREERRAL